MDELLEQLQQKTGLPVDQLQSVVEGVIDFLKDKLPEPLADQVAGLLDGTGGAAADGVGGLLDKAQDLLGGLTGGGGGAE